MNIRIATEIDKPALVALINDAYEVSAFFKLEKRINEAEMNLRFSSGTFIVLQDSLNIVACIYYKLVDGGLHFSLLSVTPTEQGKGLSKLLIQQVEDIAIKNKCPQLIIDVVNLREPLFPFYQKLGFTITGTKPFPKTTKLPCHLVIMVKQVK